MQTIPRYASVLWPFPSLAVFSGSPTAGLREELPRDVSSTFSQSDWITQVLYGIREAYVIPRPVEVFRFLRQHPSLAEVVWETAHVLRRIFDPDVRLSLDLVRDPEAEYEELFAFVHVEGLAEEVFEKLRAFDEGWFLDQQDKVHGLFNVDVMFTPAPETPATEGPVFRSGGCSMT